MGEGRESPSPSRQSDKQLGKTSDAQGVDDASKKEEVNKAQLEVRRGSVRMYCVPRLLLSVQNLESNPKGPLEDPVKEKFKKNEAPSMNLQE